MHFFTTFHKNRKVAGRYLLSVLIHITFICCCSECVAQSCPPNIDFETGTFNNWTCYWGYTFASADGNAIILRNSGPLIDHHTMYSANTGELDPYGDFPVICPNGSGHSIKLGSTHNGGEAEGVSYDFTIPANDNAYSLIYHYAVVLQSPNHLLKEQPRMVIEVTNVTDNETIDCASFTFIAEGTTLPGFEVSAHQTDTTAVLFKRWTAVSIDLSGNAGKTIRLFFKTADCTLSRHFGYAYIDVNSECNGNFIGAKYCPDDSVVNVEAPFGFQSYTWYDNSLASILGTAQKISIPPPPPLTGATIAVKLEPYDGYGCPKTLFAILESNLKVTANAGTDTFACNNAPALLGTIPKPGLSYQWSPVTGLNDPFIANPLASPGATTTYVLTTSNSGGGCAVKDTVIVKSFIMDTTLQLIGKAAFCLDYGESATLVIKPEKSIQWFKDGVPVVGATQTSYRVRESGNYYALLENVVGCQLASREETILVDTLQKGITYPVKYAVLNLPLGLQARPIGQTVLWKPLKNLDSTSSFTPVFRGATEQLYTIDIQTAGGCLTVDTQLVRTVSSVEIYVPNAFTPNHDGINDFLRPLLRGVEEVHYFRVYNRSGQLLFQTQSAEPGWDGTFKGQPQLTQAVVWVLSCVGLDNVEYAQKGTCVLLR